MPRRSRSTPKRRSRSSMSSCHQIHHHYLQDLSYGSWTGAFITFVIAINAYLLNYINNLEKENCECSKHWQRDYIKYFSMVAIILSVLMIITSLSGLVVRGPLAGLLHFLRSILGIASLVNIFVLFHYSTGLRNKDCECSEDTARTFMTFYYLSILVVVVVLLSMLIWGAVNAARV